MKNTLKQTRKMSKINKVNRGHVLNLEESKVESEKSLLIECEVTVQEEEPMSKEKFSIINDSYETLIDLLAESIDKESLEMNILELVERHPQYLIELMEDE